MISRTSESILHVQISQEFSDLGQFLVKDSLVAQMIRTLLGMQEIQVRSLGQEDPLENGMATHSSILAWKIPWTEEPGRL